MSNNRMGPCLPDKQEELDETGIELHKVGISGYEIPIMIRDKRGMLQHTIGNFTAAVSLTDAKGTHMSRFVETLQENGIDHAMNMKYLSNVLLPSLVEIQGALDAYIEMSFKYFIHKKTPASKRPCSMPIDVWFRVESNRPPLIGVEVPVTTLCPCSKEISKAGAHNQRGYITIELVTKDFVWIEDLVSIAEESGSCPIYPLLKRPDEKWVTEEAYSHPGFVEDIVRNVTASLLDFIGIHGLNVNYYRIHSRNEESIHLHDAFAERKMYLEEEIK